MNEATTVEDGVIPLPLDAWHRQHGARMVPFAGHAMPIQFAGIIAEHEWTRSSAGLFDVSHMGQIMVEGAGAGAALERLLPADLAALRPGSVRYSLLLAEDGGILDDLMITNTGDDGLESFALVVNGATKHEDAAHLGANLPQGLSVALLEDRALLALQGPQAADVLASLLDDPLQDLFFMQARTFLWRGAHLDVARLGYTGEDGFEISLPSAMAQSFADALAADPRVRPAGLGARDSLRLEAGLPLYGHDIDKRTDPVSAGLAFAISRRRRVEGGYPGAARISRLLKDGAARKLVGLEIAGRIPAREGAPVHSADREVGRVTSGGFAPSLGRAIALAYVPAELCQPGTALRVGVRERWLDAQVVALPFVPHRYHRPGVGK